ncbi:Gamma-aminobutyraldehyde dehydrogenase [Streptomyces violarus]
MAAVVVGDPADEKTQMGPLDLGPSKLERVRGFTDGVREADGVRAILGNKFPEARVLVSCRPCSPGSRRTPRWPVEEVFGPVAVVLPFDGEEDALRLANATDYGLAGSVWSRTSDGHSASARGCARATSPSTRTPACAIRPPSAATSSRGWAVKPWP